MRRAVACSLALIAALAAPASGAPARSVVVSCGDTITQSIKLTTDLTCPIGFGLAVGANGIVLDLNHHTISGNTGSNGVQVTGYAKVTIQNGVVSGFYDDIALVNAPSAKISGVSALRAAQNGIALVDSDLSTVSKATVVGSQHNGIYVDSDGVELASCSVSASLGGVGFDLLGTQDVVSGAKVYASAGSGVLAEGPGEQISKSLIQGSGSGNAGIHLVGVTFGSVTGNTVTGAGSDGILLDSSGGLSVSKNTVSGSVRSGIKMAGTSSGGIVGNTTTGNGVDGIEIAATFKTAVGKNQADLNGYGGIEAPSGVTDLGGDKAEGNGVEDCSAVIAC